MRSLALGAPDVIVAVLPALDEEGSVGDVVRALRPHVDRVVVVDNGSRDATSAVAAGAGAHVVLERERGYGAACLRGVAEARSIGARTLLFLDADGSEDPSEAPRVLTPLGRGEADLVVGVRSEVEPGAMTGVQRFGNWFAPFLMRAMFGAPFHDLSPFKAIDLVALDRLELRDRRHGFTIELMLRAHALGLRIREVPVRCRRRRAGVSKVSGTVVGASRAAVKIVTSIARHAVRLPRRSHVVACAQRTNSE
jgi:glycosyltransferase involved in cell wall biosynthesis